MLPIPFEDHIPELLKRNLDSDAGGLALTQKANNHLNEWKEAIILQALLKMAERCPAAHLNELGYMFAAGIFDFDSERTKRQKIYYAIAKHKRRGSWIYDAKLAVDAICGGDAQLVAGYYAAEWILWAKEATDADDYTGTMGKDGIDDELGLDLVGGWTECAVEGVICIDTGRPIIATSMAISYIDPPLPSVTTLIKYNTSATLSNGNFAFIYQATVGSAVDLYLTIYDESGTVVKTATVIVPNTTLHYGLCVLENDDIVVVYVDAADSNRTKFQIYDSNGDLVTSAITVDTNGSHWATCCSIFGQRWALAYYDATATNAEYVVYEDNIPLVNGTLNTGATEHIYLDRYNQDEFIATFRDVADSNRGKFIVIKTDGSVTIAETLFAGANISYPSVSVLDEGNGLFGIAYADNDSSSGKFVMYKQSAVEVAIQEFTTNDISYVDTLACANGNFAIAYEDGNEGKLIVYTKLGDLIQSEIACCVPSGFTGVTLNMMLNETFTLIYSQSDVWVEQSNPKAFSLTRVRWVPDLSVFVAVGLPDGTDAYLVTSTDGEVWTERANPLNVGLFDVAWSPTLSLLCAVGNITGTEAYIITSPDGETWKQRTNPNNTNLRGVAWSPELALFCAVGYYAGGADSYIITSPDGINWIERSNTGTTNLYGICWSSDVDLFVAVGQNDGVDGLIFTSPDGINWTERTNPKNAYLRRVTWSPDLGIFVAVGDSDGTDSYIVTSPDGITWTERSNPKTAGLIDVAWSPDAEMFIAPGNQDGVDDYMLASFDGITWTEVATPRHVGLWSVDWSSNLMKFCVTGSPAGADAVIYTGNPSIRNNFIFYDEGLGADDIERLIVSFEEDIAPAYMKIQFIRYNPVTGLLEPYPNGVIE